MLSFTQSRASSFVGFDFNVEVFEFLDGPRRHAALLVWVHETVSLLDVIVNIILS